MSLNKIFALSLRHVYLIKKHGRQNLEDTFLKIARSKNELE